MNLIERNASLAQLVKEQRGYFCQLCGEGIPKAAGGTYVEAHHLDYLSDGGLDFSRNLVIVCPNCHKRFHYSGPTKSQHDAHHIVVRFNDVVYDIPLERAARGWGATVQDI